MFPLVSITQKYFYFVTKVNRKITKNHGPPIDKTVVRWRQFTPKFIKNSMLIQIMQNQLENSWNTY